MTVRGTRPRRLKKADHLRIWKEGNIIRPGRGKKKKTHLIEKYCVERSLGRKSMGLVG